MCASGLCIDLVFQDTSGFDVEGEDITARFLRSPNEKKDRFQFAAFHGGRSHMCGMCMSSSIKVDKSVQSVASFFDVRFATATVSIRWVVLSTRFSIV